MFGTERQHRYVEEGALGEDQRDVRDLGATFGGIMSTPEEES